MNSNKGHKLKIMLIGDAGVGKSSIVKQYVEHEFSRQYKATIEADFTSKRLDIDGESTILQIWDTAGQERFRSFGPTFYSGTDICIFVYDVTCPSSFENINKWRAEFNSEMGLSESDDFPFMILYNKSDLPEKSVQTSVATEFAKNNGNIVFYEVSASNSTNISTAFEDITRKALKKLKEKEEEEKGETQIPTSVVNIESHQQTEEEKGETQIQTSFVTIESHQETEEEKSLDMIIDYIRFLEERLSKYENVEPIDINSISKVIAMYDIEVGPKNNKKKGKIKRQR